MHGKSNIKMTSKSIKLKNSSKQNFARNFAKFCQATSLHGYSYLQTSYYNFVKFLWVLAIIGFSCLAAGFLVKNTEDYFNSTIVTTIESSTAPLHVRFCSLNISG